MSVGEPLLKLSNWVWYVLAVLMSFDEQEEGGYIKAS